jgi:hypothetical protein
VRRGPATLVATVALAAVATVAAPHAGAATVSLRVESSTASAPLFDGTVSTLPHSVDGGDGSGAHPCSAAQGGEPSATATGALDDAMRAAGISWRGNWDPSFHDFFIDRIGPYASAPPDTYWSLTINGRFSAGGCQARVADGDAVRFFFGPLFGEPPELPGGGGPGETPAHSPAGGATGGGAVKPAGLRRIAARAAAFLRRNDGPGREWGVLALAARGAGDRGRAAAELLGGRLGDQGRDGSIEGDVNATAVAVLALDRARPSRARAAARWLARVQGVDGGFGFRSGVAADVDSTGLAAWGLALEGRGGAARRAGAFIARAANPDGGFPSLPGGGSNAQSTGLALVGLRVSGLGPRPAPAGGGPTPLAYLASLARGHGSIAYGPDASPTPVWTTAQALLGLTTKRRLLSNTLPGHDFHGGNDLD